jgi:hypothetical protein
MVVDAYWERVRVEEEGWWLRRPLKTLEGPEMDRSSVTEPAREGFHATTNPEGGHGERKKVSSHPICSIIISLRNKANRFLVPFNFLRKCDTVMSLGMPGVPPEEGHAYSSLVLVGNLVGECGDDMRERVNKKVSQKLTCSHFNGPKHEC